MGEPNGSSAVDSPSAGGESLASGRSAQEWGCHEYDCWDCWNSAGDRGRPRHLPRGCAAPGPRRTGGCRSRPQRRAGRRGRCCRRSRGGPGPLRSRADGYRRGAPPGRGGRRGRRAGQQRRRIALSERWARTRYTDLRYYGTPRTRRSLRRLRGPGEFVAEVRAGLSALSPASIRAWGSWTWRVSAAAPKLSHARLEQPPNQVLGRPSHTDRLKGSQHVRSHR
jgi:hypothetical protein